MVNVFSVLLALGSALGLYQVYRLAPERLAIQRLDAGALALLAGLLGARAGYVVLNWFYYSGHRSEIMRFWEGGLAWEGAVLGALLALPAAACLSRAALPELADNLAHLLPPLAVAAWLGCWQTGCSCAPAQSFPVWWALSSPDETGLVAARFPLQPAAALLLGTEFLLAQAAARKKEPAGQLAALFTLALGCNLLLASFFTAGPAPLWNGLRPSTWSAAALTAVGMAAVGFLQIKLKLKNANHLSRSAGERVS